MNSQDIDFIRPKQFDVRASESHLSPTIFHEPWWLNIVSNGAYQEVVASSGGRVEGRLPFILSNTMLGVKAIGMPSMTHVLGPALAPELMGGNFPRSLRQISTIRHLLDQLPKASHISFRLHGGLSNTLGFAELGFSSQVDYTVEIPGNSVNMLWRGMRDKTRNVIRRAQERLTVSDTLGPEVFLQFYEANLQSQGLRNHYLPEISHRLLRECLHRGAGRLLGAIDDAGRLQSAIFTVWDQHAEYYFMSTRALCSMNGATSLLIWLAMQHAALNGLTFDMDIIHVKQHHLPNLRLLSGFGGVIKPRYVVRRTSPALQIARIMRNTFSK